MTPSKSESQREPTQQRGPLLDADHPSNGVLLPRRSTFTPVRSPESNGVCEAFVKTLKRDYARVNPRPDAISVLQQIPAWFENYNTIHPHSGLRMRSPREFIAQQPTNQAACPL